MVREPKETMDDKDTDSSVAPRDYDQKSSASDVSSAPSIPPKSNKRQVSLRVPEIQEPRTREKGVHTEYDSHEVHDNPERRKKQEPRTQGHKDHAGYSHHEVQTDRGEYSHRKVQTDRGEYNHREVQTDRAEKQDPRTQRHKSRAERHSRYEDLSDSDDIHKSRTQRYKSRAGHSRHEAPPGGYEMQGNPQAQSYNSRGEYDSRYARQDSRRHEFCRESEGRGRHGDYSSVPGLGERYSGYNYRDELEGLAEPKRPPTLKELNVKSSYGAAFAYFNPTVRAAAMSKKPENHTRRLTPAERKLIKDGGWGVFPAVHRKLKEHKSREKRGSYKKHPKDERGHDDRRDKYPQSYRTSKNEDGYKRDTADILIECGFCHLPGKFDDANRKKKITLEMGQAAIEENRNFSSMTTSMYTNSIFVAAISKNHSMLASVPSSLEMIPEMVKQIGRITEYYGIGIEKGDFVDMWIISGAYNENKSLVDKDRSGLVCKLLSDCGPWFGQIVNKLFYMTKAQRARIDCWIGIFPRSNNSVEIHFEDCKDHCTLLPSDKNTDGTTDKGGTHSQSFDSGGSHYPDDSPHKTYSTTGNDLQHARSSENAGKTINGVRLDKFGNRTNSTSRAYKTDHVHQDKYTFKSNG